MFITVKGMWVNEQGTEVAVEITGLVTSFDMQANYESNRYLAEHKSLRNVVTTLIITKEEHDRVKDIMHGITDNEEVRAQKELAIAIAELNKELKSDSIKSLEV